MPAPQQNRPGYNPEIHHRRSIRLKGHDYAGGGVYFVTICAHRKFIRWADGHPFGMSAAGAGIAPVAGADIAPAAGAGRIPPSWATCVSPVREIIAEEWLRGGEIRDDVFPGEYVVMPDHFHGLIRIKKGRSELGHAIGAFKAAVTRRFRWGDTHVVPMPPPPFSGKIWHRNYYETIVRTPEAEARIAEYIRMNPWKLVQHATHEGQSFRMIGNPALLNREKIALLCSRNCPPEVLRKAEAQARKTGARHCFIGGFHAPPERALLDALLHTGDMRAMGDMRVAPTVICCPAWGIDAMRIPSDWLSALEANRMLILEMRNRDGDLVAAEQRNRFVLAFAEKRWIPHIAPGGMLERLVRTLPPPPVRATPMTRMSPHIHFAPHTAP